MSHDVSLETKDVDGNPIWIEVGNITYNLTPMTHEAGMPYLGDIHDMAPPAGELAGILDQAITRMLSEPDMFKALNPPNGWGNYDGALKFLTTFRDACIKDPSATVRVY